MLFLATRKCGTALSLSCKKERARPSRQSGAPGETYDPLLAFSTGSGLMLKSARELSEVSTYLGDEVEKFLDSVRAAYCRPWDMPGIVRTAFEPQRESDVRTGLLNGPLKRCVVAKLSVVSLWDIRLKSLGRIRLPLTTGHIRVALFRGPCRGVGGNENLAGYLDRGCDRIHGDDLSG